METKNLCTLDPRVKDQYVYHSDRPTISAAQLMRELYEYHLSRNHISSQPGYWRPVHAHEFKERR